MPFIPSSTFEQKEKREEIQKKMSKKIENNMITQKLKESDEKKKPQFDTAKIVKEINKASKETKMKEEKIKEKPITLAEIKNQIKISHFVEQEEEKQIDDLLANKEIGEIKNEAINVLALTHFDPVKRRIFAGKLHESEIVNEYINSNLILRAFNKANSNIKFGVVYGLKYLQTNVEYDNLVQRLRMQQELAQQQVQKVQQPVEAPKGEQPKPTEVINEKNTDEASQKE